ncbi:MAG: hypothetical protein P4N59_11695 [Negativicutes bacterium]|nr:hypothetical protein [Negativicutes bacterium]
MKNIKEVEELRLKQKELRRQADELEASIENSYRERDVCPDCDGSGFQTIMVPKRAFFDWKDSLYRRLCTRCQGNGEYAEALSSMREFLKMVDEDTTEEKQKGRNYWG